MNSLDGPDWQVLDVLAKDADRQWRRETEPTDWWLTIAHNAVRLKVSKENYTGWVTERFGDDSNRFAASATWDIVKLGEVE